MDDKQQIDQNNSNTQPVSDVPENTNETQNEVSEPEQPETNQDQTVEDTTAAEPESKEPETTETNETPAETAAEEPKAEEPAEPETHKPATTDPAEESETAEPEKASSEQTEPADESDTPTHQPTDTPKNDNPNAKWYVVHTYSGHENKVAHTLKQRVESEHLENKILDVLVPTQDKIEIKGGKKVNIKEKIFPGCILVKMVLDDISWLAVRTTQGVTAFVGIGNKPTPISEAEVQTIVKFTQTEAPMYKQVFMANDTVKIVDGPFADFIGKIDSVDEEKGKVRVLVSIFGRETPVELDFLQVTKI